MSSPPTDLAGLKVETLRRAATIYVSLAYPDGDVTPAVTRRLDWRDGVDAESLLTQPPFERANRPGGGAPAVYALRLGNARYPHMKLQVQPWPNANGFLLSVNTHDQALSLDLNSTDAEAFRQLQAENQRLKEVIEQAWDEAGLPTFLRYLRDYIESQAKPG